MDEKLRIAVEIYKIRIEIGPVANHSDFNEYVRKIIRIRRLPYLPQIGQHLDKIVAEVLAS